MFGKVVNTDQTVNIMLCAYGDNEIIQAVEFFDSQIVEEFH